MKIGILTQRLRVNYGGILQNFALQQVLMSLGYDVETININLSIKKKPFPINILIYIKRFIKKYILRNKQTVVFYERVYNSTEPLIRANTDKFINKYIHVRNIDSFTEIRPTDYDILIAGSDQVWRGGINGEGLEPYFFEFAQKWSIKRIAYAASFGVDYWYYSPKLTQKYFNLIKLFDLITMRERKAVKMIKEGFGLEAFHVVDPTFLLDKSIYQQIVNEAHLDDSSVSLLIYILDENSKKTNFIDKVSKEKQLKAEKINAYPDEIWRPISERIQPSVELWLQRFMKAKFIITDSFHACVFAILFHKEFVVIENEYRGASRMRELLEDFSLQERILKEKDLLRVDINNLQPIDFKYTDNIISQRKEYSLDLLKKALHL